MTPFFLEADIRGHGRCPWLSADVTGACSGQVSRSSARPALAPSMKARISAGSRIRAGLAGSADWRSAIWPPGSFLASRQEPPLSLHGLRQPPGPRSAAGIPLRAGSGDMRGSVLLQDVSEDGDGLVMGG